MYPSTYVLLFYIITLKLILILALLLLKENFTNYKPDLIVFRAFSVSEKLYKFLSNLFGTNKLSPLIQPMIFYQNLRIFANTFILCINFNIFVENIIILKISKQYS